MENNSYRDLRVWQEAMKLSVALYKATEGFPKHELYGLTNQMRRAAVSVPSNIAEGKGHRSDREFTNFLHHARGSLLELQTQIEIAWHLQYLDDKAKEALLNQAWQVGRGLNGLIKAFRTESRA